MKLYLITKSKNPKEKDIKLRDIYDNIKEVKLEKGEYIYQLEVKINTDIYIKLK